MKVSKEIRKNAVDYSMNAITDICTNIGPRESGMPKEREAQEWIKNQIDANGWAVNNKANINIVFGAHLTQTPRRRRQGGA